MNPPANRAARKVISFRTLAVVTLLDGLFFSLVGPSSANSLLIIIGTALLAAGVYVWVAATVRLLAGFWPINLPTQKRLTTFIACFTMLLVLMQSVGQLSGRDVLILVPLGVAFYLYWAYVRSDHAQPSIR